MLESIPEEVLISILAFLDVRDIARVSSASKAIKAACDDNMTWYKRCTREWFTFGDFDELRDYKGLYRTCRQSRGYLFANREDSLAFDRCDGEHFNSRLWQRVQGGWNLTYLLGVDDVARRTTDCPKANDLVTEFARHHSCSTEMMTDIACNNEIFIALHRDGSVSMLHDSALHDVPLNHPCVAIAARETDGLALLDTGAIVSLTTASLTSPFQRPLAVWDTWLQAQTAPLPVIRSIYAGQNYALLVSESNILYHIGDDAVRVLPQLEKAAPIRNLSCGVSRVLIVLQSGELFMINSPADFRDTEFADRVTDLDHKLTGDDRIVQTSGGNSDSLVLTAHGRVFLTTGNAYRECTYGSEMRAVAVASGYFHNLLLCVKAPR